MMLHVTRRLTGLTPDADRAVAWLKAADYVDPGTLLATEESQDQVIPLLAGDLRVLHARLIAVERLLDSVCKALGATRESVLSAARAKGTDR